VRVCVHVSELPACVLVGLGREGMCVCVCVCVCVRDRLHVREETAEETAEASLAFGCRPRYFHRLNLTVKAVKGRAVLWYVRVRQDRG